MSWVPQPLSAAIVTGQRPSRSASGVVAKAAKGFQVFRIDGYSLTKTFPGGEGISSEPFTVGGRTWQIDYYPNGADASTLDSDAISLYLRLLATYGRPERVRAQYKFSLLDLTGAAAYELPAETAVFTSSSGTSVSSRHHYAGGYPGGRAVVHLCSSSGGSEEAEGVRRGYDGFITGEELERRRESLLRGDCLAVRCDIGVTEVGVVPLVPKQHGGSGGYDMDGGYDDHGNEIASSWDGSRDGKRRHQPPPTDDREFVRRCLSAQRRRA